MSLLADLDVADRPPVLTIGYGTRQLPEFLSLLREHNVSYLIDVRTNPASRVQPEFSGEALASSTRAASVRYVFMGESLGGRPSDLSCYTDGRVDYAKCRKSTVFQHGLDRVVTAWEKKISIAIMCSERRPHECHRSKLIGQALTERGIRVLHIDERDNLVSQEDILARVTGYSDSLFGVAFLPLKSRHTYNISQATEASNLARNGPLTVLTIGAYGFDEQKFFQRLVDARVDTFCDLRQRRGMRGSTYSFANSRRLQDRLRQLGMRYMHLEELAPPSEVRDIQKQEDTQAGVRKRDRVEVSQAFRRAYIESRLRGRDPAAFIRNVGQDARRIVLFCVERDATACHRSIVATWLADELGAHVEHLAP